MAEPQEVPNPNQEQEVILQRSPFLRSFLGHPPVIGAEWLDDLEPLRDSIEREIASKLGNRWWTLTLAPIALMAGEQRVFDTTFLNDTKSENDPLFRVVTSLFLMGYEIGNRKDSLACSTLITQKLSQHGLFPPVSDSEAQGYAERVFNTTRGIVVTGAFIKLCVKQAENVSENSNTTDPFRNFIEGLDSLDNLPRKNK